MSKYLRISQIRIPVSHSTDDVIRKALHLAGVKKGKLKHAEIFRRSIDARKKDDIHYVYSVNLEIEEDAFYRKGRQVQQIQPKPYQPEITGTDPVQKRIVVIGFGPAGIFCSYLLALHGYCPLVLERGKEAAQRSADVERFWKTGVLDPGSNVQFGEGGAGAFSDGKLNTMVKDKYGRNRFVLETFVRFGAPEEILYDAKPHIGTDLLKGIIADMRREIIRLGGEVRFQNRVDRLVSRNGRLTGLEVSEKRPSGTEVSAFIPADAAVLCIGHSARDTFSMLLNEHVPMEAKPFAVGLRVEHPQEMINIAQYGEHYPDLLPVSPYKLTYHAKSGRGVYSFCMCPGGYVVNASSEPGRLAINGMSEYHRNSGNANSAIVMTVSPEDYPDTGTPLSGITFQRNLEEIAFQIGNGKIPQQLLGDFEAGKLSSGYGTFSSCIKGKAGFADLRQLFSNDLNRDFLEGMHAFGKKIRGFDRPDTILSGVESRTSSPVRILRDSSFQSPMRNLYPCGEGAGYAGGITSAAMDGLKCAEELMRRFQPVCTKKEQKPER